MCGINGFIKFKNGKNFNTDYHMKKIVHGMNRKIIHRGPDAEGLYSDEDCSLGMRRLSIIDLHTGAQPIYNSSHDKLIVFNGEIYNYRELRDELIAEGCVFHTKTDTEVILLGIEWYGKDFIKRLEGMFAFCIYDMKEHVWMLVRDRTGEKPLYYYKTDEFLIFGSELKSLLSTGLVPKEIDRESLSTYFQLAYIPAPGCIIKNIHKLMPAMIMEINEKGEISTESYWRLQLNPSEKYNDYNYCKRKLREKLFYSVSHKMVSDVPVGAFLSGGFDSAVIVGIMAEISDRPVDTFTIGFKEKSYDESGLADMIAKRNGTNQHVLTLDWNEAVKDIDTILNNIDEPFADPSLVASYAVSKMTREYVKVALTGDAGDELFAGYNKYLMPYYGEKYKKIPKVVRKNLIEPTLRWMPGKNNLYRKINKVAMNADLSTALQVKRMMCRAFNHNEAKQLLLNMEVSNMNFIKEQFDALSADKQKRMQYADFKVVLEGQMLPKVDRASMLASLETRIPMLDKDVIELAFHIPTGFKISGRNRKIILKDAFRDKIPNELYKKSKHGFDVPVGVWLDGILKKEVDKYKSEEYLARQGLFSKYFIDTLVSEHKILDIDWSTKLWSFFVFQRWYENFILESNG